METTLHFPARGAAGLLFAEDFDFDGATSRVEETAEPEVIEPHFTADDVGAARTAAWNEGRQSGLEQAGAAQAASTAQALAEIARALRGAAEEARAIAEQGAESIARLLLETVVAVLPDLCASHGENEVRNIVRVVLPGLLQEPVVTIRIHPRLVQAVQQELTGLDPDLSARVRLVPTETMRTGDVRISWQDGVAEREAAALQKSVTGILCSAGLLIRTDEPKERADAS